VFAGSALALGQIQARLANPGEPSSAISPIPPDGPRIDGHSSP
jgi:hypothetical protein